MPHPRRQPCLVLLEAGHNLVVLDNFSKSSPEALRRVAELEVEWMLEA